MERQARRKKIASQETDRMALITGRIGTPDLDNMSTENIGRTSSQDYSHGADGVADTVKIDGTDCDEDSELAKASQKSVSNLQKLDKKEFRVLSLRRGGQPDDAAPPYKPFEYHLSSLSPKEIHFSIISSENTRVVCSFVIAFLVVLSHVNLPHNVVKSKSLIAYRPLYALLLTDALIVAARLALFSGGREDDKDIRFEGGGGGDNWEGAVKLLEWGLVLHQTVRAVFIDCSFYVAIVACGLSMV